ncbi:unnamed protein product [Ixodes hexagonus]
MLRAGTSCNERRRQLRWVRERALNQTREIEGYSLEYHSVLSPREPQDSPGDCCHENAPDQPRSTADGAPEPYATCTDGLSPSVSQNTLFDDDSSGDEAVNSICIGNVFGRKAASLGWQAQRVSRCRERFAFFLEG